MVSYAVSYEKDISDRPLRCRMDPFAIVSAHSKSRGKTPHPLLARCSRCRLLRLKSGCHWRLLPHDFPPWSTVYYHFGRFLSNGLCSLILKVMRAAERKRGARIPNLRRPSWTPKASRPSKNRPTQAATTPTRTSKGASATSWWTLWVFRSRFTAPRPIYETGFRGAASFGWAKDVCASVRASFEEDLGRWSLHGREVGWVVQRAR
jgi:transposase